MGGLPYPFIVNFPGRTILLLLVNDSRVWSACTKRSELFNLRKKSCAAGVFIVFYWKRVLNLVRNAHSVSFALREGKFRVMFSFIHTLHFPRRDRSIIRAEGSKLPNLSKSLSKPTSASLNR